MNIRSLWKKIQPCNFLEGFFILAILFFLFLGNSIPLGVAEWLSSALGMSILGVLTVYIFSQSKSKALALLICIAAFELIRRSFHAVDNARLTGFTYDGRKNDLTVKATSLTPPRTKTLEEHIIDKEAPIGYSSAPTNGPGSEPVGEVGFHPVQAGSQLIPSDAR